MATVLVQENKMDSAIAVIDRCLELVPNDIVPYEYFAVQLLDNYIKAGANDKGIPMIETAYSNFDDELNYYLSLDTKHLLTGGINEEIQRNLFYMQRLQRSAAVAGDKELAEQNRRNNQLLFLALTPMFKR